MTTAKKKTAAELRSARWFAPDDLRAFGHRSRAMQMGYAPEDWVGRPVIAILNTWSEAQPCHMHFKSRVDDVKRGILQAGGFPMELPALSLSESFLKPTTMLYRNLLAMDAEELLRGHPVGRRGADGRLRQDHAGSCCWARSAPACRRSTCRLGRCCAATGRARSWARAPTPGNTGTSAAPARSPTTTGSMSRRALRAATAPA